MSRTRESTPRRKHGYCKLTHRPGAFVKSHLLPQALTRPTVAGAALVEYGEGRRPGQRWTSWYDSELVTRAGEDVLSALDTWAIAAMRAQKLVWSGWGDAAALGAAHEVIEGGFGAREVVDLDTARLRLFFLSLLWRAAASTREEFAAITLPPDDLEHLRRIVLGVDTPAACFYPVQLIQLSTRGVMHNQTPYPDMRWLPDVDDPEDSGMHVPIYRFYLDGLIAHVHRTRLPMNRLTALGNLVLGQAATVLIPTVTFEDSLQAREMHSLLGQHAHACAPSRAPPDADPSR